MVRNYRDGCFKRITIRNVFFCAMFDAFFILLWVGASSNVAPLLFCFLRVAL